MSYLFNSVAMIQGQIQQPHADAPRSSCPQGLGPYSSQPLSPGHALLDAIEESVRLGLLANEYGRYGIDVPKALVQHRVQNEALVRRLYRDDVKQRLQEAEGLVKELASKEQKRAEAEKDVERLRALLGE